MATIIRRSADKGDPRLPRIPFKEPGRAQPTIRLSALAYQGDDGDAVSAVQSPEGGVLLHPGGSGTPTAYEILPSGVPVYNYDSTLDGQTPARRPTSYRVADGRPVPQSMIAVVRLVRWPTSTDETATEHTAMHIVRASTLAYHTIAVIRPTADPSVAKRIAMRGNGAEWVYGPEFPDDGDLHFVAAVFDGTQGRLYFDGVEFTGPIAPVVSRHFMTGYAMSGGHFQLAEAAHYAEALTPLQVEAKWQHYRAMYHF